MRSFLEYVENKHDVQFEESLLNLLTPIIEEEVSFDDFVENVILPVFKEDMYAENENDLLDLFEEGLWDRFFGGRQQQQQVDPAVAKQRAARQAKVLQPINDKVQELINNQLQPVIQKITQQLKQNAYQTNNKQLFRAAQLFNDKLTKTAQSIKFKVSGSMSQDQKDVYNKERRDSRYTPTQQKDLQQAKQQMMNRRKGLVDDGSMPRLKPIEGEPQRPQANPMTMQDMTPQQRQRLQRRMQQRRQQGGNVVGGGVGQRSGNQATA